MEGLTSGNTLYGILYFLFMSMVVLGAAYFATKFIAKKGRTSMGSKNLKIVETVSLGLDKSLILVKAGKQFLLLGSTPKGINFLAELEAESISLSDADALRGLEGENIEEYLEKLRKSPESSGAATIKSNLNKLKSIVRGSRSDE